jgi:nucleoside-diphosphate-sugar epimerase
LDEPGVDGEPFNFGPHERIGVENQLVASKICEIWGGGQTWTTGKPRQEPFEKQSLSWDKANERLGWQPTFTIYETLQQIATWYRSWSRVPAAKARGSMVETNQALMTAHRKAAEKMRIWWSVAL